MVKRERSPPPGFIDLTLKKRKVVVDLTEDE
jgi:hypothetical protein